MHSRHRRLAALVGATVALHGALADAIVVARVTRRGYIITDDVGDWGPNIPVSNTNETVRFVGAVTAALTEVEGFHEGRFLAAMQIPSTQQTLAFYLPIRNDVRGIGERSVVGDTRNEVFDTNSLFDTAFPLDGFVYLNSYRFYTDPRAVTFGRFLICTQEFGHRFGAKLAVPAYPQGDPDASVDAAADASVDASVDAAPPDAPADAAPGDAPAADGSTGPAPLARDALLGRGNQLPSGMVVNRAHWSYFFNTGGSPMEGNLWTEIAPGMFRTERPTFRFSPIDLYLMGLIPPAEVPTTFLIAEPQNLPRGVSRDSPPEYYNRQVTVRGRRVDVSIQDIVRANGARNPAYPAANRDLDVNWVLLAEPEDVNDELAAEFDEAVDSCAAGYAFATADRGRLVTTVPGADPDAGPPDAAAPEDAAVKRDAAFDPDVPNIPMPDGMATPGADASTPAMPAHAEGGCSCRAGAAPVGASRAGLCLAAAAVAVAFRRRRRR